MDGQIRRGRGRLELELEDYASELIKALVTGASRFRKESGWVCRYSILSIQAYRSDRGKYACNQYILILRENRVKSCGIR